MMLKILLPAEVMMKQEVKKIIAEAENGSFCLMPNHIDFVATLSPGIFTYEPINGGQELLAMDVGTLVKKGSDVLVSTRNAVRAPDKTNTGYAPPENHGSFCRTGGQKRGTATQGAPA
jgi:F-type H+-transporting ATPase subunit epsilon